MMTEHVQVGDRVNVKYLIPQKGKKKNKMVEFRGTVTEKLSTTLFKINYIAIHGFLAYEGTVEFMNDGKTLKDLDEKTDNQHKWRKVRAPRVPNALLKGDSCVQRKQRKRITQKQLLQLSPRSSGENSSISSAVSSMTQFKCDVNMSDVCSESSTSTTGATCEPRRSAKKRDRDETEAAEAMIMLRFATPTTYTRSSKRQRCS